MAKWEGNSALLSAKSSSAAKKSMPGGVSCATSGILSSTPLWSP